MRTLLPFLFVIATAPAFAQAPSTPPLTLSNRDLLPLSPEAASLGRYGDVPVSLYTGVPSIEIPLYTFHTTAVDVPVRLQYHGGGVRLDQKATWAGLGWNLMAGGAITRVCRGIDDFAAHGYASGALQPPSHIAVECGTTRIPGEASYDYVDKVLKGEMDSQADLFSFNFLGYSGSFVLDQQGVPHFTSLQLLRIVNLKGTWQITTPDGTQYEFGAAELTQPAVPSGYQQGISAWYLTSLTTRFGEKVAFDYGDYSAAYDYPPSFTVPGVGSLPTATTSATYHSCGSTDIAAAQCDCPTGGSGSTWWAFDRPGVHIQGKYLKSIVCGPTRMDFFSSAGRTDGVGLRRLDSVQVKYLPESTRFKRFRMRYDYLSTRLCLRSLTEVGYAPDGLRTAPPYEFSYDEANAAASGNKAPGSPSIDRFGYFNGKNNRTPFLPYKDQQVDLPGADREVDATCVTFGLLRRIIYPTGGSTDFAFESNDFSNTDGFYHDSPPIYETLCVSNPDPATTQPSCGNLSATKTLRLTHPQRVDFNWSITDDDANTRITDVDVDGSITDSLGICANCPSIHFATDRQGKPMPISAFLPAGTYYLAIQLTTPRYIQATLGYSYVARQQSPFRGKPGGGTRIRRIASYDGIDHRRDLIKEYYYRDDANTHSTGKLSHDMAFATWVDRWNKSPTSTFETVWSHCRYLQRSAQDVMGAAGTTAAADVGYDAVTVVQRNGGEILKSRSIFTNEAPNMAQLGTNTSILPGYASRYNFYEQNGRLLSTLEWKVRVGGNEWSSADCQLVRRVENVYTDSVVSRVDNLLIGGEFGDADSTNTHPCVAINAQQYHTQSFWSPLVERTETLYGPQTSSYTATTTRWHYQNLVHQQPSWEESTSGSGSTVLKRFKYAPDYASSVASAALLQQQYMLTTPLEQQQWRQQSPASARKWVGGTLTTYVSSSTSGAVPALVQQANLAVPNVTVQEPRNAAGAFTALVSDPAYQPRAAYAYYGTGELAEQHLMGQPATAYIWGYGDHHLIASAHNAHRNAIAYTSFEPNATGRWQFDSVGTHYVPTHFTGMRGYQLDGTSGAAVRCIGLPAGEYELSVWAHGTAVPVVTGAMQRRYELAAVVGTSGWHQHRFRVSVLANSTVTINSALGKLIWIDELRICPAGAQMTSYTHAPLVGKTSQTDLTGRTLTYEYDALGRLMRTRDEQGRILAQQQYHYAQH